MKNVKLVVRKEIVLHSSSNLKNLVREIRSILCDNFHLISFLKNGIKTGLIICFILIFNSVFATNHGKENGRNTDFISLGASQISDLNQSAISYPISNYQIPFTLMHNLILIEATVGGKKGLLLLDTGTDQLILNQNHFRGITGSDYISGVHDDMAYSQRKYVKVQIGDIPVHSQNAFITDLSHLEQHLQIDILGICGIDFLQQYQWVIHYHQRYIEFLILDKAGNPLDKPTLPPPGEILSLQKEKGQLSIQVRVNNLTLNFALDTGSSSTVLDKRSKPGLENQNENLEQLDLIAHAVGINGSKERIASFALSDLKIGNTTVPSIQVTFLALSNINRGRQWKLDGVFNPLLMCHGTIGINWKKKRLYIWEATPKFLNNAKEDDNWLANMERIGSPR